MAAAAPSASSHKDFSTAGFGTRALHIGQAPDAVSGAVTVPVSFSSTFAQSSPGVTWGQESALSYGKGYEYSRTNNPTRAAWEIALAGVEGGKHCVAFSSGMSATTAIIHLLKSGDHVISMDDVYGGTQRYFRKTVMPTYGMTFDFVDLRDTAALEAAFARTDVPKAKLVWLETPTNPTLKVANIAKVAAVVHKHGALLVVDNTFMSPFFQNPLKHGADIVLHSVTKFVNGHSDVVGGALITNSDDILDKLRFIQNGLGAVPGPMDCYLALRGLKTLHVRMERHGSNALALAKHLEAHSFVERVLYPGLPSHPDHEAHLANTSGGGGMVTFYIKGGVDGARRFMESVEVFTLAESLGAVESLVESPAIMTHASVPAEARAALGISDNLVRLSVGIENIEDLLADVDKALAAAEAAVTK